MSDIFISYASQDRSRAEPLAKALEEQGWSVWWDRTIPPGKTFDQVIEEAIKAAKCVVVLWSKISIKSDWVREEANIAKQRNILIPAKIDPVDPPIGFGRIQAADLTNWDVEKSHPGFLSLRRAISEVAGPPPERGKSVDVTKLPGQNLEQQLGVQAKESETFQPDLSHLKPDERKSPIAGPKAPRKRRLAFGMGGIALILVLSVIGWFLYSKPGTYTIKVSADPNGSISPTEVVATHGDKKSFTITPKPGYRIVDVLVDGRSVGAKSSYTFERITSGHKISASFMAMSNLARSRGAKASQSTTSSNGSAERAIDGNTDGDFRKSSVTHTDDKLDSWWEVMLPSPAVIEEIVIWNRSDCCWDRLSNLLVLVLDDSRRIVWAQPLTGSVGKGSYESFRRDLPVKGRYVKIELQGKNKEGNGYLSLAEVQVFGEFTK